MENADFIGKGWGFPPTFNKNSATVEMLSGREDIISSINILLTTNLGERVMQPRYGLSRESILFDPIDANFQAVLLEQVRTSILYYEPRVILNDVILESVPEDGIVSILIDVTIAGTNTRFNFVYPFYLEEGTDIRSLNA